jgi:hypothetical protein
MALALVGIAVAATLASCTSDSGEADEASGTTETTSGIVSDLIETGEQVCTDEAGDVTTSATADAPPPVAQPGADILGVTTTLDDAEFSTTFELAGPADVRGDYLLSVGLLDDFDGGFEIQIQADDGGVWGAELTIRTEGTGTPTPLRDADVFLTDTELTLVVPREALPTIGRDQPLLYGTSTIVRDGDVLLGADGEPTTDVDAAARALDDCVAFGQ